MAANADIARANYEAWNNRDMDAAVAAMAPDGQLEIVGTGDVYTGPDGFRRYNEAWATGFPDGRVTIDRLLESGDTVVVEFTGRGTHTGTMATSMGDIPATGKSIVIKLCDVTEFRDGKIVHMRTYLDTGSMMAQLGLLSPQTATQAK